jgi:hypothetical protein
MEVSDQLEASASLPQYIFGDGVGSPEFRLDPAEVKHFCSWREWKLDYIVVHLVIQSLEWMR